MSKFFTKIKTNPPEEDENEDFFGEAEQSQESLIPEDETKDENWVDKEEAEGQLSVDVFQTKDNVVIKSTIAGVKPEDIDISIDNDMITIRGERRVEEKVSEDDFFYQECYWGSFSRSIVLPIEVKAEEVEASLKNGVLTVTLPKVKKNKSVAVKVKSE